MKYLLASVLLAATSCASTGVTRIHPGRARAEDCPLDVYTAESEVKRPFQVVCLLDATSGRSLFDDRSVAGAIDAARPEACGCGADALIVMSATTTGMNGQSYGEGTAVLRAIRYTGAIAPPSTESFPPASTSTSSAPVAGTERGECYGNGTCNDGLTCASNLCVRLPATVPQ